MHWNAFALFYIMTQKVASFCGEFYPTSTSCSSSIWNQYIDEMGLPSFLLNQIELNSFDFNESKIASVYMTSFFFFLLNIQIE